MLDRAVPRQSIERTSSPGTYSRRLSNSVPWPRCRMRRPAVQLAQPGQPAGQVLASVERRQRPYGPGRSVLGLPTGDPERADRADHHRAGMPVAAAGRPHGERSRRRCRAGMIDWLGRRCGRPPRAPRRCGPVPRSRLPAGVGQQSARWWPARRAGPTCRRTAAPAPVAGDGQSARSSADHRDAAAAVPISTAHQEPAIAAASTVAAASAAARQVQDHQRGTGTVARIDSITESAVTPSSSASGPQAHPVPQGGEGQGLHVVGGDVVPAGQPGPGAGRVHDRGRAPRRHPDLQRRREPGRPDDVDDVGHHLRMDDHRRPAPVGPARGRPARLPRPARQRRDRADRSRARAG